MGQSASNYPLPYDSYPQNMPLYLPYNIPQRPSIAFHSQPSPLLQATQIPLGFLPSQQIESRAEINAKSGFNDRFIFANKTLTPSQFPTPNLSMSGVNSLLTNQSVPMPSLNPKIIFDAYPPPTSTGTVGAQPLINHINPYPLTVGRPTNQQQDAQLFSSAQKAAFVIRQSFRHQSKRAPLFLREYHFSFKYCRH